MNPPSPANQTNDPGSRQDSSLAISSQSGQEQVPIVFISYSHDTKEHKAWVASLAQRLVDKGVDVLLDQWDLGPGDDVPKFMEQAVAKSDRVLMICTDAYVLKANDGKGGVGYEAMVVTGELVQNLGTNKFIPIVRQSGSPKTRPRCVSTRFYVDLSDVAEFETQLEILLREIHNVPKLAKPALGKNPFTVGEFEGPRKKAAKEERRLEFSDAVADAEAAYHRAHEIIHNDDRVAWRKLLLAANEKGVADLKQWKTESPDIPEIKENESAARFAHVEAGVRAYAPFIACLVAAAETGKAHYADQLGWVEIILEPTGWNDARTLYHLSFPQTILYVAQAFVGGMLMQSSSGEAAYALATTKIADSFHSREPRPLFLMTPCNGWPETLEHHCTVAWGFLNSVISSWAWLSKAFGNENVCRSSVSAYYQLLSFLNFVKLAKDGKLATAKEEFGSFPVTVPVCFCIWPADIVDNGYKMFLKQSAILLRVLETNSIGQPELTLLWANWMKLVGAWLMQVYVRSWPQIHVPQNELPKNLVSQPYLLT